MGKHSNQLKHIQLFACLLILAISILAACAPVSDRTPRQVADTDVVLKTFAYVPNIPEAYKGYVNYINYAAMLDTRGLEAFTFEEAWSTPGALRTWTNAVYETDSILQTSSIGVGPKTKDMLGFTGFDVDRELTFSGLPRMNSIMIGRFNLPDIESALRNRDFTPRSVGESTIWCGAGGCDQHFRNPENIVDGQEFGNLFGGDLGRRDPIFISSDTVLDAGSQDMLEQMLRAGSGEMGSIASDPRVITVIDAAASRGTILQLKIVSARPLIDETGALLPTPSDSHIPDYGLIALAHLADGDKQIAAVFQTVSGDPGEATEVANNMHQFILEMPSHHLRDDTFAEFIREKGGLLQDPATYYSPLTGRYAAMALITYEPLELDVELGESEHHPFFKYLYMWLDHLP